MRSSDYDPTKWVDDWPLRGLSLTDRQKIKSQLLKAHAVFHRARFDDVFAFIAPMQQAFNGIASILCNANLLTVELLENELQLFVLESGIAGGWIPLAKDEPRTEIFPSFLGNATVWNSFHQQSYLPAILLAEIADWRSKLLDKSIDTVASSASMIHRASPRH